MPGISPGCPDGSLDDDDDDDAMIFLQGAHWALPRWFHGDEEDTDGSCHHICFMLINGKFDMCVGIFPYLQAGSLKKMNKKWKGITIVGEPTDRQQRHVIICWLIHYLFKISRAILSKGVIFLTGNYFICILRMAY